MRVTSDQLSSYHRQLSAPSGSMVNVRNVQLAQGAYGLVWFTWVRI